MWSLPLTSIDMETAEKTTAPSQNAPENPNSPLDAHSEGLNQGLDNSTAQSSKANSGSSDSDTQDPNSGNAQEAADQSASSSDTSAPQEPKASAQDFEEPPAFLNLDVEKHPKYQSLNDKYLRLHADFDNFRRRAARENLELIQTSSAQLLGKVLPTLENLERAFDPQKKATRLEDFEEGIRLIFKSFKDVLNDAGLEEINPEGEEFDPLYHEALMQQPHPTLAEGKVAQVFSKGYKVKNKILKHAKVVLSTGPAA